MADFLIDPAVVDAFLDKPIDLEKEWKLAQGLTPDGTEKPIFYTPVERKIIVQECDRLYAQQTEELPPARGQKSFTLTAGAPGAGKTTFLNAWVKALRAEERGIYADPDETILKRMAPYLDEVKTSGSIEQAYIKWRWASNYISGQFMNRAGADGHHIIHGTTATSPAVAKLYKNIREAGYESNTLIIATPQDVCLESARRRYAVESSRYTPADDIVSKGKMFYQRLPLYFEQSDSFSVFWREKVDAAPALMAFGQAGKFQVPDDRSMQHFEDDLVIEKTQLNWPKLITLYLQRYPDNGLVPYTGPAAPRPV